MMHGFGALHALMQQAVLQERIAEAAAAVAHRRTDCRLDLRRPLETCAAVQDQVAATAADLARGADRSGERGDADLLWHLARASRVRAMLLRARSQDGA